MKARYIELEAERAKRRERRAALIRDLLQTRGMSRADLARACRVSPQTVTLWTRGVGPRRPLAGLCADALGVPLERLEGWRDGGWFERLTDGLRQHLPARLGGRVGAAWAEGPEPEHRFLYLGDGLAIDAVRDPGEWDLREVRLALVRLEYWKTAGLPKKREVWLWMEPGADWCREWTLDTEREARLLGVPTVCAWWPEIATDILATESDYATRKD